MKTLNQVYSSLSTRRRYEVWFVRMALADGSGAWWFRYLLMNPGREGCANHPQGMPVQVWATWFPNNAKPQTFIQGCSLEGLELSAKDEPFHLRCGKNVVEENSCRGELQVDGHDVSWELQYLSSFRTTLSNKGWIGFSRTPHSDAVFSGHIKLDGKSFEGSPLGFGLQGHNCGYRHRTYWIWTHAFFQRAHGQPSTLEALVYEMPFGLVFRKAVLWHDQKPHVFRHVREVSREPRSFKWEFVCQSQDGFRMQVAIDGTGQALHCLPYLKTDGSGSFAVMNNSWSKARLSLQRSNAASEILETSNGAVLEMGGRAPQICGN